MPISGYRIRSMLAYRRKNNLCQKCGAFLETETHTCIENYIKTDMRGIEITKDDPLVVTNSQETTDSLEKFKENAKRKTLYSFRLKKDLCPRCGMDFTPLCREQKCEENYETSDRRNIEKKEEDPRTIITPKKKETSILDLMEVDVLNKEYLKNVDDDFLKLVSTVSPTSICSRPYIIIDINPSEFDQRIEFSYINFMVKKYTGYVIFLLGDPLKIFSYSDILKLRKMIRLCPIRNLLDQNLINHICGCKRFFGFPSKYSTYCLLRSIPLTLFFKNSEGYQLNCSMVSIDQDQNVDIELVKRNVISWRV